MTIHPDPQQPHDAYPGVGFAGLGLLTNHAFDLAYQAAEDFTAALQQRTRAAGFMKTLLLQRHLFQLCLGPINRREDSYAGKSWRTKTSCRYSPNPSAL